VQHCLVGSEMCIRDRDMSNLNDVMNAGARRVAVVRSLVQSDQPTLATQYFLSQLHRVK
jgi:thiamine-phosphate pyrophosphorylase